MAVINIARGPWSIDTTTITNTARNNAASFNVIVTTVVNGITFVYALTVAEAITLSVTIPQIPQSVGAASVPDKSLLPDSNIGVLGTESAGGRLVIVAWGVATTDANIVAQIGADSLYADGSIYHSVGAGAGSIWIKINDVWTQITVP